MDIEFFLDAVRLRDHVSDLTEEKYTAQRLENKVKRANQLSDPQFAYQFNHLVEQIERLIMYYSSMAAVFDDTCSDAEISMARIRDMMIDSRFNSGLLITNDIVNMP